MQKKTSIRRRLTIFCFVLTWDGIEPNYGFQSRDSKVDFLAGSDDSDGDVTEGISSIDRAQQDLSAEIQTMSLLSTVEIERSEPCDQLDLSWL